MFRKKVVAPSTVSDAIAPFRQVKDNLVTVMTQLVERKATAAKRITDANAYAAQVTSDETIAADAAQAEMNQAERIANALASLLGEDAVIQSGVSTTAAERAKKINKARVSDASVENLTVKPTQEQLKAEQASAHD
jgi:hypothetical protein